MSREECEVTEGNVFAALGRNQPEKLLVRAQLLNRISTLIKNSGLSQHEVAMRLGISQLKVCMLISGGLSGFSDKALLNYLAILSCE